MLVTPGSVGNVRNGERLGGAGPVPPGRRHLPQTGL